MHLYIDSTVITVATSLAIHVLGWSFPQSLIAETATRFLITVLRSVGHGVISHYAMHAGGAIVLMFLRGRVEALV